VNDPGYFSTADQLRLLFIGEENDVHTATRHRHDHFCDEPFCPLHGGVWVGKFLKTCTISG